MDRLPGRLQHYDWGSSTALAALRGVEPSGRPEAELWFGTNRAGSAGSGPGPDGQYLPDGDPDQGGQPGQLDQQAQPDLPYLVKLLAADRPLSLQAHPDARAAADGYLREEEAGLAPDDPTRSFPDPGPKPELLCAITRFEALCGFRPVPEALEVARALDVPAHLLDLLDQPGPDAWRNVVGAALAGGGGGGGDGGVGGGDGGGGSDRERDIARLVGAARNVLEGGEPAADRTVHEIVEVEAEAEVEGGAVARAAEVVCRLADRYPTDPALLLVPMLRRLVLQPGEAMFVGPGVLHAYLGGMALEVMTPCDNVVRGGFTSKHVDTGALVDLLDPGRDPGVQRSVDGVHRYEVPVEDFAVWRIEGRHTLRVRTDPPAGAGEPAGRRQGPDVVVAIAGRTVVGDDLVLAPGEAALVPAADGAYRISVDGIAHRVSVGG